MFLFPFPICDSDFVCDCDLVPPTTDREMGDSDIEGGGGGEDDFRSPIGRKYRPVLANDRAVLEMSSMDPGSSSTSSSSAFPDPPPNLRYSRFRCFRFILAIREMRSNSSAVGACYCE